MRYFSIFCALSPRPAGVLDEEAAADTQLPHTTWRNWDGGRTTLVSRAQDGAVRVRFKSGFCRLDRQHRPHGNYWRDGKGDAAIDAEIQRGKRGARCAQTHGALMSDDDHVVTPPGTS
jgi:hypothetical protein